MKTGGILIGLVCAVAAYFLLTRAVMPAAAEKLQSGEVGQAPMATASLIPTSTPTASLVPTATVGYLATADAARATADAAVGIANSVISTLNVVNIEQARITQEADVRMHEAHMAEIGVEAGILTQAVTAVPLTQAAASTQVEARRLDVELQAAWITSTWAAPTQIAAAQQAENEARFGAVTSVAQIAALFGLGLGGLALVVFVVRQRPASAAPTAPTAAADNVVVSISRNGGQHVDHRVWPGTLQELMIMADEINRDRSLAVNRWDKVKGPGGGMLFSRPRLQQVLFFLVENGLAIRTPSREVVLVGEGADFFEDALNLRDAPLPYKIDPKIEQELGQNHHNHENHGHDGSGGGVFVAMEAE